MQIIMSLTMFKLPEKKVNTFNSLDDFHIGKLIGDGAFSKVYEGIHLETNKKYAVKVIDFKMLGTLD